MLVHLLVRLAGAGRIIVSDLHPERLATRLAPSGPTSSIDAGREDPVEVVRELTGGSGADVSIEAVGCGVTARQTIGAVRNAGTVVWLGNSERRDRDRHAGRRHPRSHRARVLRHDGPGVRARADLAGGGRLPVDEIVNRYARWTRAPELFEQLLATPRPSSASSAPKTGDSATGPGIRRHLRASDAARPRPAARSLIASASRVRGWPRPVGFGTAGLPRAIRARGRPADRTRRGRLDEVFRIGIQTLPALPSHPRHGIP